ncbi:hypothetical protein ACJMK2_034445 [Sinanodonta woodiana]|uniref:Extracellular matrix protein FRAS1 n=1 Tax=Sinanodonta woodiana TaxID=1069815 RepID=A0ABD3WS51_SINWO
MGRVFHRWIHILYAVVGLIHVCSGDCLHNGMYYMKHTVWQPNACTVCTCEDPIVLCETIRCTDPKCDFKKGEYLQISADGCCPECVPKLTSCQHQQQIIPHNTEWSPEPCRTCRCFDGEVTCSKVLCPITHCKPGEVVQNLPGQCCPQCIPAGSSCTYNGERHLDGSEWEFLPCTKCVCRDGQVTCYPIQCAPIVCREDEQLETPIGDCCPVCQGVNNTCRTGDKEYKSGDQWSKGVCTMCVCMAGETVCSNKDCMDMMPCPQGERKITRLGDCCPECVSTEAACLNQNPVRFHGDIWNVSSCEYCACNKGQVQCHTAGCEPITCTGEEIQAHFPGDCCPQCVMPPSCHFEGLNYQDEETWHPNTCSVCHCNKGEITCYRQPCKACPEGSVAITRTGECCGECKKVACGPDCLTCNHEMPAYCTSCNELDSYVEEGRCVKACRPGYYSDTKHICRACHLSCHTCQGESQYHCETCKPGLMWRHGECVTQCGSGYYIQNGKCLDCHVSCKSCTGPGESQCQSCVHLARVVESGRCIDYCPANYYVKGGNCIACPPTCRTCTPDGSGCATCWPGGLIHQGQCVTRCPVGYSDNKRGSCSACHPSCESCDGGKDQDCMSCFGGSRLSKRGRCRSQCPLGKYLTFNGTCQDCVTGCTDCYMTWDGKASICSECQDPKMVPSGSKCQAECGEGQYLESKICQDCGENCMQCDSPSQCKKCLPPFLLYMGKCVTHCGQGQYEDGKAMECKDCIKDCLQCFSAAECSVCNGLSYLADGRCVRDCGSGFSPNPQNRHCEKNVEGPIFQVLSHVHVEKGGVARLTPEQFYIADPDTMKDHLHILLKVAPGNGDLKKVVDGHNAVLRSGDQFTFQDLLAGKIFFFHSPLGVEKSKAMIEISDGVHSTQESLYFQAYVPNSIRLTVNNVLHAVGGETTVLGPDILNFWTNENPEAVTITVLQGPKQGSIVQKALLGPVRTFSLQDLRSGNIVYQHNPRGTSALDAIVFQASGGFNLLTFLLNIEIRAKENQRPMVIHNKVGYVVKGDSLQITSDLLLSRAMDRNADSSDIIYTLIPPFQNPKEGEVMMVVPIPPSGPGRGWEDVGDGLMAARMNRFLQRDIDEGRIYYKNKGTQGNSDIIRFEVADMATPTNILKDQNFHVIVVDEQKLGVHAAPSPTLAPGVRLGMTVLENQVAPITSLNLAFRDQDTPDDSIVYTIVKPLGENEGLLENIESPFRRIAKFTQDDINNNRIIYRPPDFDIGYKEREVSFTFIVSDGQAGKTTEEQKFSIRIIPVNNMPPRFSSSTISVTVSQGGSVPVGQTVLGLSDADTPLSNLSITVLREPRHGYFEKNKDGLQAVVRTGDTFSFEELEQSVFRYSSDKSDSSLLDMMQFSVSDGVHKVTAMLNVTIVRVDRSAPTMLASASCRLPVLEGEAAVIKREHLAFVDSDSTDDKITIQLALQPTHGRVTYQGRQLRINGRFTQADINNGYISYHSDKEIGQKSVTEILAFNVTDSSNNSLPNQVFTVLIEPVDNQPPRVRVGPKVLVEEGEEVILTGSDIIVTDVDTLQDKIIIVMETQPSFGVVKDTAPAKGSQMLQSRLVNSFPHEDLLTGHIVYEQNDHKFKEPVEDGFLFHVFDGTNKSPTYRFNITIQVINDEPPLMVTEQVFAREGHAVTVTNASIYILDIDSHPEDLALTLKTAPMHGHLRRKDFIDQNIPDATLLPQGSKFTYRDILNELIVYEHDNSEVTTDSFTLHVTDSNFEDTKTVSVIIGLVSDEIPRVMINRGLRVQAGSVTAIKSQDLKSTDLDSDDAKLLYTITQDPPVGSLELHKNGSLVKMSRTGPYKTFTQTDINNGNLVYKHNPGQSTGNFRFKFKVSDPEGNDLIDQEFYITIMEDRFLPKAISNKELVVAEGGKTKITTDYLSFTDVDSEPASLKYLVIYAPKLGQLEFATQPGVPISEFTQMDLAANNVQYVHTSKMEFYMDRFTFTVTDGTNDVTRTFFINISPIDDSIPLVVNRGLTVQEGVRKIITEFDLKALDNDTQEDLLVFTIIQSPVYGDIELYHDSKWSSITTFSMKDIFENHVSYNHDGSETREDNFSFIVSDGTNDMFAMQRDGQGGMAPPQTSPQDFEITILPVDHGSPVLVTNLGLQFLETSGTMVSNLITSQELQASDSGTPTVKILYVITKGPRHGRLEKLGNPGEQLQSFTQDDIDKGRIRYVLTNAGDSVQDSFTFDLLDTKPNRVPDNLFHIMWSVIEFEAAHFNITEMSGVQFDEWQNTKVCTIIVNDDSQFEGPEEFYVQLSEPSFALLGSHSKTTVAIYDIEDEPILQFKDSIFQVNESDAYVMATIVRTGMESGGGMGIVDDSDQELSEQFMLELSSPSLGSKLGPVSMATVVIQGPNDESLIYFSLPTYHFDENAGTVEVEVLRDGTDLSHSSMVWCATRLSDPPSATPGQDYIPSSSQITFGPGQTHQMQFVKESYTVDERNQSISVPVMRMGDLSFESSVICYTRQETAQVMMDYDERFLSEASRIFFKPGVKIENCTVTIINDGIYEPEEKFRLELAQPQGTSKCDAWLGAINKTTIIITNKDDVPTIQFEKAAYSLNEPSLTNQIVTMKIKVIRMGDLSATSSVRVSTRDGSAMSGVDYNPKSLMLKFEPGVNELEFSVDILYNADIEWHEAFTVVLGPGNPEGAELGLISSTTITILDNEVSGSLILPAVPLVVSLLHYDKTEEGMKVNPSPGYPIVCVTPCDTHYPSFTVTHTLCHGSNINQSNIYYRWEVAMPSDNFGSRPPFVEVSDKTLFTSINKMVLDSVYFRPSFRVRCVAQPVDESGNPGIPLKSKSVTIGRDNGICNAPVFSDRLFSYQAQSFLAKLDYVGPDDIKNPNTIHLSIQVPHQDGMLPLISTYPLHNLRFLLAEPIYRQQHVCSNIITPEERDSLINSGFLDSGSTFPEAHGPGYDFPFQFDNKLRTNATLLLYKHLNLKSCLWTFDAWYHMSDLVEMCGGRAVSDFQVTDAGQTYLTVRVPLYVSYLYATAPIGWGSLEHRTEMEFSFYYDTVLWQSGLETDGDLGGRLQVMRIVIGDDGKLVVDFKTQAKFRGAYVLEHQTLPGYKSRFVSEDKSSIFKLSILWSQNTFDSQQQLWRAVSDYSLKDYTGEYTAELIPCSVHSTQRYTTEIPIPCTAHKPVRFEIPIAFQQTNRPVPLEYTLNTHFQLTNNRDMFLLNPMTSNTDLDDMDFNGAFSEGQKIFGRVLWNPKQDLKGAYKLTIEKVFLCTGRDGYIPTFDPTGKTYGQGAQFGCIQPGPNLQYRFLILDRGNPDVVDREFNKVPFESQFADENPDFLAIENMDGVDGFVMSVDPLYKVTSGHQWYLQVLFLIGSSDPALKNYRNRRSAFISLGKRDISDSLDGIFERQNRNGTNIKVLHLNQTNLSSISTSHTKQDIALEFILIPVIAVVLIIFAIVIFLILRKKRQKHKNSKPKKRSNLEIAQQNSVIYKGKLRNSIELKNSTVVQTEKNRKPSVRVKDTNLNSNKKKKENGTEV